MCVAGFAWRFATVPWDLGGSFLHLWLCLVGGFIVNAVGKSSKASANFFLIPFLFFLTFSTIYYAPQSIFPFMFTAGIASLTILLWSERKHKYALVASLILILLLTYCKHGISHMLVVNELRNLKPDKLSEVCFNSLGDESQRIIITEPNKLSEIAIAFRNTSPYSPNHEGIVEPWTCTITLDSGEKMECTVGNGNVSHPNTMWLQFDIRTYQNPIMRDKLESFGIILWSQRKMSR